MIDEETLKWLSNFSPVQFLTEANRGFSIRDIDKNIVKELQEKGLSDEVINVLLYFVLLRGQGLRFDLIRELADTWIPQKITTMEEALVLAKKEDLRWQEAKDKRQAMKQSLKIRRF